MLFLGAMFKATTPDESDEERRELERWVSLPDLLVLVLIERVASMVAEAAAPKPKHASVRVSRHKDRAAVPSGTAPAATA
jgi:hypothetical protein